MRQPLQLTFILRRPYAHLADQLREDFKGNPNVAIVVDRRYGQRRMRQTPVPVEWRQGDRRMPEEMLSVVIGTITQLTKPAGSTP